MIKQLRAFLTRRRFERAFRHKLAKIEDQRRRHAPVKLSQADLRAAVNGALARKLSA